MTRRRRQRDLVDLMQEREFGYRLARGYDMMDNDEDTSLDEEDEELFGMSLEVVGEEDLTNEEQ